MQVHTDGVGRRRNRREFLTMASSAVAASASGFPSIAAAQKPNMTALSAGGPKSGLNIVFIFTDQERYQSKWPSGLALPGHERLQRTGVTFHNHYCPAVMCSSSRAVMMTGLQTTDNGIFENLDVPWVKNLSTKIPTIGHMMRKAGYYTAYKGKWHLSRAFDTEDGDDKLLTRKMEQYGFADFNSPGDIVGHTLGGYQFDNLIAESAVTWLRRRGRPLTDVGKPWCLAIGLVNPHDVMYFNTDAPGEKVQDTGTLLMHAARAPDTEFYKANWDVPLPKSLTEPFDTLGRPPAHVEFLKIWNHLLGHIPNEEERWRRFNSYYINCLRDVDQKIVTILQELDSLRLTDRTIVVFTSDHGEMAGAHGLHGKGPFAYQDNIHLPFHVVHPDVKGGQDCSALTSHIDLAPTLMAMAGVDATRRAEIAGRNLPGKDASSALSDPAAASLHTVRDSVLFSYSGLATNDSGLIARVARAKAAGKRPTVELLKEGYVPDLKKRGSVRSVFDGRHKLTRYFSPLDHNRPATIDALYKVNDVEMFDLNNDPAEMTNLARDKVANRELILTMNKKLETVITGEMGADDGRELPYIPRVTWTIDRIS